MIRNKLIQLVIEVEFQIESIKHVFSSFPLNIYNFLYRIGKPVTILIDYKFHSSSREHVSLPDSTFDLSVFIVSRSIYDRFMPDLSLKLKRRIGVSLRSRNKNASQVLKGKRIRKIYSTWIRIFLSLSLFIFFSLLTSWIFPLASFFSLIYRFDQHFLCN